MPDTQQDQLVSQFLNQYMAAQPPPAPVSNPFAMPAQASSNPLSNALGLPPAQAPAVAPAAPAAPKIGAPSDSAPALKMPVDNSDVPFKSLGKTPEDQAAGAASARAASAEGTKSGLSSLWGKTAYHPGVEGTDAFGGIAGTEASGIKNPFLRALARVGVVGLHTLNGIGGAFAPEVVAQIPGTPLHHRLEIAQAENQATNAQTRATSATDNVASEVAANNASFVPQQIEDKNANALQKLQDASEKADLDRKVKSAKITQDAINKGNKLVLGPDGKPVIDETTGLAHTEFDPDSPAGKRIILKGNLDQAVIEQKAADTKLKEAQAEVEKSKNDPNSPKYKLDLAKLAVARQNANAASSRAQTYNASYQMHAHGTEADGVTPLNGIPMLDGKSIGTVVAPSVIRVLPKQQQMADVAIGLNHTDSALKTLEDEGGSLNSAAMASALSDPSHSSEQWAQGKVKSTLSPAERDAVVQVTALRERIMAMRSAAGGGVSDSQVNRLVQMLPSAATPDYDTAKRQLDEVGSQLATLEAGVPQLNRAGGHAAGGNAPHTPAAPASSGHVIQIGDKHYRYSGNGNTADLKNYAEVAK